MRASSQWIKPAFFALVLLLACSPTNPTVDAGRVAGGLSINGSPNACSHTSAAPDVVNCGIAVTAANLDAAAGATGFGGNAFIPGGGSISNF